MRTWVRRASPLVGRLASYRREEFLGDLIAGLVVAVMLVPQAMAYAMLAGLPPQVGLYASIVPVLLYALFGTSTSLAVGPVAMVSLLVVAGVGQLATPGTPEYVSLCLLLALMVGVLQVVMALFRMGFLVNFISHPVLSGFTSAAAIVIGFSQVKHLTGASVEPTDYPVLLIVETMAGIGSANVATLVLGLASILLLSVFAFGLAPVLKRLGIGEGPATTIARMGPLVAVSAAALFVAGGNLDGYRVAVVGEVPAGLPRFTLPTLDLDSIRRLLPLALVITLVGFLESVSVAKALASRRREKVDPDRELFALGIADVGAALTGAYPVTGGFSRSLVNFSAGARTPMASIFTAGLVALSVAVLTPLFFHIPKAALAAIIVVAVVRLIDLAKPFRLWRYSRSDAIAFTMTFLAVLAFGIETGILVGVACTVFMLVWSVSRPHVAEVGRIAGTEHFRNILRHEVVQIPGVLAFRIDESLNYSNAPFLTSYLYERIADRPEITHVLLIASGINKIDATGIEVLETSRHELESAGVQLFLSDVKGPVMDRLKLAGMDPDYLERFVFLSAHLAMVAIERERAAAPPFDAPG